MYLIKGDPVLNKILIAGKNRSTIFHISTRRLAQCSCEQLLHLIKGGPVPEKHIIIPTDILPGQTLLQANQL